MINNQVDLVKILKLNNNNFDEIKMKISNVYNISEDEKVFLISKVKNNKIILNNKFCELDNLFINYCSYVFTKDKFRLITRFPKISYKNEKAKEYLKNNQDINNQDIWDKFTIMQSFEGPLVQVFFYDKWYISTEVDINAGNCYGNTNKSIKDYFLDTNKLDNLDKLDKNYAYHFVLLHNRLKHIVQYTNLNYDYKELVLTNITQINNNVNNNINNNIINNIIEVDLSIVKLDDYQFLRPMTYYFSCFDELEATLEKITYDNAVYKRISTEGFIIKHYIHNQTIQLKLQTQIYKQIKKLKPLKQNNYQTFLELYQHDKLNDILPYISKYSNEIIHRINMSMRTLSREILNIYHTTRKKKNSDVYDSLSDSYKKLLYEIHGLYIKGRRKDFVNGREIEGKDIRSITVHDIYYHLKNLPSGQLKQIYLDRIELMKNITIIPHLNLNCIYTLTQSRLMSN